MGLNGLLSKVRQAVDDGRIDAAKGDAVLQNRAQTFLATESHMVESCAILGDSSQVFGGYDCVVLRHFQDDCRFQPSRSAQGVSQMPLETGNGNRVAEDFPNCRCFFAVATGRGGGVRADVVDVLRIQVCVFQRLSHAIRDGRTVGLTDLGPVAIGCIAKDFA